MDKKTITQLKALSDNESLLDKVVVTSFLTGTTFNITHGFLHQFIIHEGEEGYELATDQIKIRNLEEVINVFELAIPSKEETENGAVYTPKYIRDYIVNKALIYADAHINKPIQDCLCVDISCGCGAFLYTLSERIRQNTGLPYATIYRNIFGIDISESSIRRAKILLSLLALTNSEIIEDEVFNLFTGNTLSFQFNNIEAFVNNGGFDLVVGNPPYVRSKHIEKATKELLPNWTVSKIGNADLYIPFFEIGLTVLSEDGFLGYITVNSFFKSVNARALRKYFHDNQLNITIEDFGEEQIFAKKLTYTCLTFFNKQACQAVTYRKVSSAVIKNNEDTRFHQIQYDSLDDHKGWHLNSPDILTNIRIIEGTGTPLEKLFPIKNGIATLANDIYIFTPEQEDERFYYITKDLHPIEKAICRDIIKPNILKSEDEIPEKTEKIIAPYTDEDQIIQEDFFKTHYPCAYEYLTSKKTTLDGRDKGEGDYEAWYAFGRTQAISDRGRKLLFPYMSDIPHFVYTANANMMIYCGYAIYSENERELLVLKRILESTVFNYYMQNTSKPYSTGYYSYAKNYVKGFGVCTLTPEEKDQILEMEKNQVDQFLINKYGINI